MKLYGMCAFLFLLVTCAYAGYTGHCGDSSSDSSSSDSGSSSSDVDRRNYGFVESFRPRYENSVFERDDPCERPRRHHHRRHHHKGISKKCRRILCDVKCLVCESYLYIGHFICDNFRELASHTKHSVESTGNKAVEEVIMSMKNLEKAVLADIVKDPLRFTMKKIEDIIEDTTRYIEKAIDKEFGKYEREAETYITGLIGRTDPALIQIIRDTASGLLPTTQRIFRDLHKAVNDVSEKATAVELRRVKDAIGDLQKDIEKRIAKDFVDAEMLVKSQLEKMFEREGSHLRGMIEKRRSIVESRLRLGAVSVEREIERAASCLSSSSNRDCRIGRTKLPMFCDSGHGGFV